MSEKDSESATVLLDQLLEADRRAREARGAFDQIDDKQASVAAISREVDRTLAAESSESNEIESEARLICMADLLADLSGPESTQLLVRILGHEEPAVRVAAGEALVELLYDRYGEIARVIETEVDRGDHPIALAEIPFLLAEVGEPGGVKIMLKLLSHPDPDVVGSAIEGLAAMEDPSAIRALDALRNDKRQVTVDDESNETDELTVGELAGEAIEHLRKAQGA